jgi:hypothetical protein
MGIITTLLALGFILLAYSVRLLFKRKPIKAGVNGLISLSLCSAGGILLLILLNVQTYQRLTHEIVLAEVLIGQKNHSGAPLSLKTDTLEREFLIRTEAWRLDARFLKWKPWLSIVGKDPLVRLERLEERSDATLYSGSLNRFDLNDDKSWLEIYSAELSQHLGLIDSIYGSSVYMPVKQGARYQIVASVSGLLARPMNNEAKAAVIEWSGQ